MFRPSAVRDTRQRRAVKISRGSLVLVDSPRKKTTSSDSVVPQLSPPLVSPVIRYPMFSNITSSGSAFIRLWLAWEAPSMSTTTR
ncbi:hypothetical protein N321_09948, partial [Antrostomus carolinensis]